MGWFTRDKPWEEWTQNLKEILETHTNTIKTCIQTDITLIKIILVLNERIEKLEKKEKKDETA